MSEKVSIQNIVDLLAEEKKISKREAEAFIKAIFGLIEETLEVDQYVKIKGLGTFKLIKISSRESINVNTGERFIIANHSKISFTPDPITRDLINKPFSHFETVILNDDTVLDDTLISDERFDEDMDSEDESVNETRITPESKEVIIKKEQPLITQAVIGEEVSKTGVHDSEKNDSIGSIKTLVAEEKIKEEVIVTENYLQKAYSEAQPNNDNLKSPNMNQEEKQGLPYFIAIIAIIVVVLSGTIIYFYNPRLLLNMLPELKDKTEMTADSISITTQKIAQTIITQQSKDTISVKDTLSAIEKNKELPFEKVMKEVREKTAEKKITKSEPVNPDSMNYEIIGTKTTYTLQPGETLIMVSKRFYGSKDLWPYIAKHNRDIIKNPDKVPFGTIIKVPDLKKK